MCIRDRNGTVYLYNGKVKRYKPDIAEQKYKDKRANSKRNYRCLECVEFLNYEMCIRDRDKRPIGLWGQQHLRYIFCTIVIYAFLIQSMDCQEKFLTITHRKNCLIINWTEYIDVYKRQFKKFTFLSLHILFTDCSIEPTPK